MSEKAPEIREELDFHLEKRGEIWVVVDNSGVSPATYVSEKLWWALNECERSRQYLAGRRNEITGLSNQQFERIQKLEEENKRAKALLGDVLDGGYGARYGWEDAHDWLITNCAEYAAKFRDPTDKEIGADV